MLQRDVIPLCVIGLHAELLCHLRGLLHEALAPCQKDLPAVVHPVLSAAKNAGHPSVSKRLVLPGESVLDAPPLLHGNHVRLLSLEKEESISELLRASVHERHVPRVLLLVGQRGLAQEAREIGGDRLGPHSVPASQSLWHFLAAALQGEVLQHGVVARNAGAPDGRAAWNRDAWVELR